MYPLGAFLNPGQGLPAGFRSRRECIPKEFALFDPMKLAAQVAKIWRESALEFAQKIVLDVARRCFVKAAWRCFVKAARRNALNAARRCFVKAARKSALNAARRCAVFATVLVVGFPAIPAALKTVAPGNDAFLPYWTAQSVAVAAPTARPTAASTARPTAAPTARPTAASTARPTAASTARPTARKQNAADASNKVPAAGESDATVSLDFVDASLADVARSLSLAYDTPIIVDGDIDARVTLHLDGVGLLEGLSSICSAYGLEVVEDGRVFHIRKLEKHEVAEITVSDSGVAFAVKNMDVEEFALQYSSATGVNILLVKGTQGVVSGSLRNLPAEQAFRSLMESNAFGVRSLGGCLYVYNKGGFGSASGASGGAGSLGAGNLGAGNLGGLSGLGAGSFSGLGAAGIAGEDVVRDGDLYSVNLESVPLAKVLANLSQAAGLNLALYGDMQESVRLKFDHVPLQTLVDAIFKGSPYVYALDSVSLFVAESGARKAVSSTRLYPLKYLDSGKALVHLQKFLPGSGFVAAEVKEQNALLLCGSLEEIEMAESLLAQVDSPTLQVTLSCIIVEIKRGKNFEIGFRSGASRKTAEGDVGGRAYFDFSTKELSKTGAFGKIGVLPDRFEFELASLEENNMAEVLARPRLTTLNGSKAELNVTNTVYYLVSQVSSDGYPITDYRSFNDGISLELTPVVTQEGSITLEVAPEIKTAGRSTGDGPRDISTRNLKTSVVLQRGETLCLGGLVRKNKSEVRSAIPFLGSIPLIGRLFSYVSEQEESSELAIFITPEVNDAVPQSALKQNLRTNEFSPAVYKAMEITHE